MQTLAKIFMVFSACVAIMLPACNTTVRHHDHTIKCCVNGSFHWCDHEEDLKRCVDKCHRDPEHDNECRQ